MAIDAPLPPGEAVPGARAMRETPGKAISPVKVTLKIGDISESKPVAKGDKFVSFEVNLPAGIMRLEGRFVLEDGTEHGTYFAYVEKK